MKEKEKLSKDIATLNKIKNIGSKIENSITEYFVRSNQPDPTANFRWEYILIENKKVKKQIKRPTVELNITSLFFGVIFGSNFGILDIPSSQNIQFLTRNPMFRSKINKL